MQILKKIVILYITGIELLSAFGNVDATFDLTPEQLLERVKVLTGPRPS